jgi:RimJ/RimL family protein N-acetyltransferase
VKLERVADIATRDAVLAGDLGERTAAPGWPHTDTALGLAFLDVGGLAFLILDADGRIAGECGTKSPPSDQGVVEIGYGLAAPSRGHGLGGAAVGALVEWLARQPGVRAIEAEVHVGNAPSWRILERLGFVANGSDVNGFRHYLLDLPNRAAPPI